MTANHWIGDLRKKETRLHAYKNEGLTLQDNKRSFIQTKALMRAEKKTPNGLTVDYSKVTKTEAAGPVLIISECQKKPQRGRSQENYRYLWPSYNNQ